MEDFGVPAVPLSLEFKFFSQIFSGQPQEFFDYKLNYIFLIHTPAALGGVW